MDAHGNIGTEREGVDGRVVLGLGFGGLLILMAFAGFDSVQALRHIQEGNESVREEFLARNHALGQIRADLYISSTYVRDYLLEPEAVKADTHRTSLKEVRSDMDAALASCRSLLSPEEAGPFKILTSELAEYWKIMDPVFRWNAEERRKRSYVFLRDQIFTRRAAMLTIADRIASINELQLSQGKLRVTEIFDRYRTRMRVTAGLTILLGLLLAVFSIRKMLGLEREARARYQEVVTARSELKELSARLVEAQENERRTISRELHDEVGQALSAALVDLGNLTHAIRNRDQEALPARVDDIKRHVENCVAVVRNMALLLRPSMLDDFGLVPALKWQAREFSKRTGMRVRVAAEDMPEELPEEHKTCIYRVVQEALHNASRHSSAQLVRITVRQESERILLSIQDDGSGFDPEQTRGLGLIGMQERVSHLGGTFQIESEPGHGTLIAIALPTGEQRNFQAQVSK